MQNTPKKTDLQADSANSHQAVVVLAFLLLAVVIALHGALVSIDYMLVSNSRNKTQALSW